MNMCSNIPIEFLLATTDSNLYDISSKRWTWSGDLYWGVECMPNSTGITPFSAPASLSLLTDTPSKWDFCNSYSCSSKPTQYVQIAFTFNNKDYLQYIVDINAGSVTFFPNNFIFDNNGEKIYFDIDVEKVNRYIEIWISKSPSIIRPYQKKPSQSIFSMIFVIIIMLLLVILALPVIISLFLRYR